MLQTLPDSQPLPSKPAASGDVPSRNLPWFASTLLIAVTFLVCTIHVTPFPDLRAADHLETADSGSFYTQIVFSLLFLVAAWLMTRIGLDRIKLLATPPMLLLAGWIGTSMLFSVAPLTSIRRFVLTAICIVLSAMLLLVARSVRHFTVTLAWVTLGVLVLSYLSIVLAPDYAMHTRLDLREPDLAGDWRGPFTHKNEAGAVMVLFVFIGILTWHRVGRILGAVIVSGAALFLVFTHSKTAAAVLPFVLAVVGLARFVRSAKLAGALLLAPVAMVGLVAMGSFFYPPLSEALQRAGLDVTFTGRTEIWKFALDHIAQRPPTGWGYGAFWRTEATQFAYSGSENWFAQADQAHNTYIDTALFMGLPGLALTVFALVLMPLRDLAAAGGGREIDALSRFFLMVWIYVLCTGFFESVLFEGNSVMFLMFMLAVFGLRFRRLAPAVAG